MNAMQVFNHGDVSVEVIELDGRQLFNATQIGDGLYITPSGVRRALINMEESVDFINVTNSMITNCSDVSLNHIRKLNNRGENFLTESGVYELMIQSRRPEAKSFRRWITREVLPSIRKTGGYGMSVPGSFEEALRLAADQQAEITKQKNQLQIAAPKVDAYDRYMDASGTMSINLAGKILGMGQNKLFEFLRKQKVLMNYPSIEKHKNTKRDWHNVPYQNYVDRGWFTMKPGTYDRKGKPGKKYGKSHTTRVTTKGLDGISRMLARRAEQPDMFHGNNRTINIPQ